MTTLSRNAILGYLGAVFLAGIAIGALTGYTIARNTPTELPSAERFQDAWLEKYREGLSLTEAQVEAVRPLLPVAVERLGGVWYRAIMTMGAIQEGVDRKVEPLLEEGQRAKLEAWIQESRAERLRIATGRSKNDPTGPDDLWFAAATGDLEGIRRHLDAGVDVNRPNWTFGMAPLAVAAVHGRAAAVDLLVERGADVNQRTLDGNTALHGAAFFGRLECVRRLLAHGANPEARNDDGQRPLEGMEADWETTQFVGAILELQLDRETTMAGREAVAELLRAQPTDP